MLIRIVILVPMFFYHVWLHSSNNFHICWWCSISPQNLCVSLFYFLEGGGANILPRGETVASFWLKSNTKNANVPFVHTYNNLHRKYTKIMSSASCEGRKCWQTPLFRNMFVEFSFGHQFWPPWTSLDSFWAQTLIWRRQKISRMRLR